MLHSRVRTSGGQFVVVVVIVVIVVVVLVMVVAVNFARLLLANWKGKRTEDGMKNGSRKTRNGRREKEMAVQVGST